jgi:hypothetical protein
MRELTSQTTGPVPWILNYTPCRLFNKTTSCPEVQGFRFAGLICHDYRYRFTTCSSTFPTVSAEYPSAQNLFPPGELLQLGSSFRIIRLMSSFKVWITSAHTVTGLCPPHNVHMVLLGAQLTDPPPFILSHIILLRNFGIQIK